MSLLKDEQIAKAGISLERFNTHFVFNVLNAIKAATLFQNEEVAGAMIDDFSKYLRYLVNTAANGELVSAAEELEFTRAYTNIQEIRFPKIKVTYDIRSIDYVLPAFTIQSVVDEMIHWGDLKNRDGAGIRISSYREGEVPYVEIAHNGKEYEIKCPVQKIEKYASILCKKREIKFRMGESRRI